jgi:signal transduction histidine kinase
MGDLNNGFARFHLYGSIGSGPDHGLSTGIRAICPAGDGHMDTQQVSVDDLITVEQAKFIHGNQPSGVIGGTLVVLIVAAVFWNVVPQQYTVAWASAVLALTSVRLWIWRSYRARAFDVAVSNAWLRIAVLGSLLSGVLWGLGSLFLIPAEQISYQLMFLWAVSMMAVAAMFSFSAHVPTYMAYFLPSTVPTLAVLLAQGTTAHIGFVFGMVVYIVIVVRFVTTYNRMFIEAQRLRFENVGLVRQLTQQIEVARSANLAKSRFLAAASHDLRQPMHALNLYLGSLSGLGLPAAAKGTLGNALQCAQTMDGMFRALLDISKLDAGSVQAEPRAFPLGPLLDRIRLEHEPQARAKGLALRVRRCGAWAHADPAFLERILRNLTANAVRHTERGRILIGCRRRAAALRIEVHDTGPGIPPEQQRLVFEEFYQVGNEARDRSKGMGLGLAIVERLAKLMQARVELRSQPVRGSTFSVEVPLAPAGAPEQPWVALEPAAPGRFSGSLVAVIDDEEMILNATRNLLEQWECEVVTAVSGRKAIERLGQSTRRPDAIVCDYRLGGGENGLAAIEALRSEFNEEIPALLITGDTGPERLREMEASGVAVLHKPVQDQVLRDALGRLLGVAAPLS